MYEAPATAMVEDPYAVKHSGQEYRSTMAKPGTSEHRGESVADTAMMGGISPSHTSHDLNARRVRTMQTLVPAFRNVIDALGWIDDHLAPEPLWWEELEEGKIYPPPVGEYHKQKSLIETLIPGIDIPDWVQEALGVAMPEGSLFIGGIVKPILSVKNLERLMKLPSEVGNQMDPRIRLSLLNKFNKIYKEGTKRSTGIKASKDVSESTKVVSPTSAIATKSDSIRVSESLASKIRNWASAGLLGSIAGMFGWDIYQGAKSIPEPIREKIPAALKIIPTDFPKTSVSLEPVITYPKIPGQKEAAIAKVEENVHKFIPGTADVLPGLAILDPSNIQEHAPLPPWYERTPESKSTDEDKGGGKAPDKSPGPYPGVDVSMSVEPGFHRGGGGSASGPVMEIPQHCVIAIEEALESDDPEALTYIPEVCRPYVSRVGESVLRGQNGSNEQTIRKGSKSKFRRNPRRAI
jgi:hypothetical protein